jgi:shikimate kinase
MNKNLVLIGFMGTGKSAVGRRCARLLGYTFRDSDAAIVSRAGRSIPAIFAEEGEAAFRSLERNVIAELAATPGLVIATGGGAIMDEGNVANLRASGVVFLLTASPEVLLKRVGNAQSRPLLASASDPLERIQELLAARKPHYDRAAHFRVDTSYLSPDEVAEAIVLLYKGASLGT